MDDRFRVYEVHELGKDGYPFAWHETIKHAVREEAGHRCVRCLHPYAKGDGEWSSCDERCRHVAPDGGPVRIRSIDDALPTALVGADGESYEAGFVRASFVPDLVAVEAAWRILTVHHLNGNKADCRWWNLVSLCQRCHLRVQRVVLMERIWPWEHTDWFKPYVAGWYAHAYLGEDVTRAQAEERMDELLALERAA